MDIDKEIELAKEYMNYFIQILFEAPRNEKLKVKRPEIDLPTFEFFKETYSDTRYSMSIPHYKESVNIVNSKVVKEHAHGLGSFEGIGYRYYNFFKGSKFYTGNNLKGDFSIHQNEVNKKIRCQL